RCSPGSSCINGTGGGAGRLLSPSAPPLLSTDLPDHPGPRNLNERTVAVDLELGVRIGLPEIPHDPVIHDVGAPVGTEPDVRGTIEPVDLPIGSHEHLLIGVVVGEPRDLEFERLARRTAVDQLN